MMLPPSLCRAEPEAASATLAKMIVSDVILADDGTMKGHVLNRSGQAVSATEVRVSRGKHVLASTMTDGKGGFTVRGLKGGVYRISVPSGGRVVRLWMPGTAPPSATETVTVVAPEPTVLGQYQPGPLGRFVKRSKYALTNPLIVGAGVLTAVGIPLAVHNRNRGSGS